MKKLFPLFIALALAGVACPGQTPTPAEQPTGTEPPAAEQPSGDVGLRLFDVDGNPLPNNIVHKLHHIGVSPCPDAFAPLTVDFPAGLEEAEAIPMTDVGWLDLPDIITSGEPFEMRFNCGINRFDDHSEVAAVKLDFSQYIATHPGVEHLAGAEIGATFIIVTDTCNEEVCADFSLPYICTADCPPILYTEWRKK
jgi:hypothetical protein